MATESKSSISKGAVVPAYVSMTSGAVAGMISRFVISPIDVVKIRLQLQGNPAKYNGVINTIKHVFRNEGIKGFWKGNVPAEIMYVIYGATQFTAYSTFNKYFTEFQKDRGFELSSGTHSVIVGALAGTVSTCISYPFDVLRTRLAAYESPGLNSLIKEIRKTYIGEGIKGFFGGIVTSINYFALTTGVSFGAYTKLREVTSGSHFESSSGLAAGIISKTVIYPLDLMRRRQQMNKYNTSIFKMARSILALEGPLGFYHGLTPALLKTAPTTAVTFWIYEYSVNFLMNLENGNANGSPLPP